MCFSRTCFARIVDMMLRRHRPCECQDPELLEEQDRTWERERQLKDLEREHRIEMMERRNDPHRRD